MSWFEDLFINEAKPALNGRPSSGGSSEGGNSSGGNSGPCSWNDLTDKPFGESVTEGVITFDGDLTGREYFNLTDNILMVKVSDKVLHDEVVGATLVTLNDEGTALVEYVVQDTWIEGDSISLVIRQPNADIPCVGVFYEELNGISVGTYFVHFPDYNIGTKSISCLTGPVASTNPIDEKYLPDTIARTSEVVPAPATASVGQTVVVKAVDENGKPTEWAAADMAVGESGSGEGGAAIIDVVELPSENIREDAFYRLLTGTFVYNQYAQNRLICYCVENLPETGEPAVSGDLSDLSTATFAVYYNTQDGSVMAYVTSMLSSVFSVPAGWYPASVLMGAVGYTFNGVITDVLDDPMDGTYRLLLEYVVYSYKDGWVSLKPIGKAGTGNGAEVFNHTSNVAYGLVAHAEGAKTTASGDYSHAEGAKTTASGNYSHAEGYETTASGNYSHAEGYETTASGDYSHAEGQSTTASGNYSHAEGDSTNASGNGSHAEGFETISKRLYQHVQGMFNIVDNEGLNENHFGKYAHIVGNGEDTHHRSNAHTLDWDGNAWFAGGIELTSPNGTRYRFTVSDDGTLSAVVVTE